MSVAAGQDTITKKPDTDKQKTSDEEEGEGEEEEEEEYDDDYGSRVVATLCRKVNPPPKGAADNDLVIAVVVTSNGKRHDAKKCADAYIENLKNGTKKDDKIIKCEMIARINQKAAVRAKKEALKKEEKEPKDESSEDGDDEDGESTVSNSTDASEAQEGLVEYTPRDFLGQVYDAKTKSTNGLKHPLGGGVANHIPKDVTRLLEENYGNLLKAKEQDADFKSTWLVMHTSEHSQNTTNVNYYTNNQNKVVVVVLSTLFFYPSNSNGRDTINEPILVCNVPYGNGKSASSGHYKGIFHQIERFLTEYNSKKSEDKIDTIAISYPKSLIGKKQPSAPKKSKKIKGKKVAKKSATTKPVKVNQTKSKAHGTVSSSEDEDEDEEDEESGEESEAPGENDDDSESSDGSDSESDEWLRALKEWAGGDDEGNGGTEHDIEIKLMYEEGSEIWGAPQRVKDYFEENQGLLQKFPYCIENTRNQKKQKNTVNLDELKTTMFVCDLEPKKRVGNNNDGATTGGVFGQWVPMHYTAAYIDETMYTKKSVEEIRSLVEVVFTNTEDTRASSETTEQIDLKQLETSVEERRKLVDVMAKVYNEGYEPPAWVGDTYANKETFEKRAHKAKVFYDQGQDKQAVKNVAMQREPVNIAMTTYFDKQKMSAALGYSESYYLTSFTGSNAKQLAPNIGVYTSSLVRNGKTNESIKKKLYHAIGAALDHKDQPDYKFYVNNGKADVAGLIQLYVSVFAKIFAAAKECKAAGIVMSLVGAESFAKLYPGGKKTMQEEVWMPAFDFVRNQNDNKKVKLALMSDPGKSANDPAYQYMIEKLKAIDSGKFPGFLFDDDTKENYKNWMIVNAWDCHTIPGNGNNKDPTIDGIIGSMSDIHYFGWGTSNPHLLKDGNMVEVAIPHSNNNKSKETVNNNKSKKTRLNSDRFPLNP